MLQLIHNIMPSDFKCHVRVYVLILDVDATQI